MANQEHLKILKQGVDVWNQWRGENPEIRLDLSGADLRGADLSGADLTGAYLSDAALRDANLRGTYLSGAYLNDANLRGAVFSGADLRRANLRGAVLIRADLRRANLGGADLSDANLRGAVFSAADLTGANLTSANLSGAFLQDAQLADALISNTVFANCDLSATRGLESVRHSGPSTIGIDTIYQSGGNIPESFLRGCGVPETFITFAHSLVVNVIEFYSCFISYSTKDEGFARRLHSRMQAEKLRVWFAPEDIKGGDKLHEQIERAIQIHDRLLIVLSENSMQSEWVMTELGNARKAEISEKRRKLFPIRLADYDTIREWTCFNADTGNDLAVEVRQYFIPDFSNWKDHDAFETSFKRLLRDLKAEAKA